MMKAFSTVLALAMLAAACGGSSDSSAQPNSESSAESTTTTRAPVTTAEASTQSEPEVEEEVAQSAFPITIEHMMGSVTIEEKPQRIVTLGFTDTDIANALGANIVGAVSSPYGDDGLNALWAPKDLDASVASLNIADVNLEAVAAAKPDLILASAIYPSTLDLYDQLSEIAPVIAPLTGPLLDSATDLTILIGAALGETEGAAALLAETDVAIASFVAANPELEGKSVVFAPREGGQTAVFIDPTAASVALLAQMGMTTPEEILAIEGDRYFGASFIGDELIGVLDSADIAIVGLYTPEDRESFLNLPTVKTLDLVANDAMVEIDRPLAAALQSPNPMSILYVLEELGPLLVAAAQ